MVEQSIKMQNLVLLKCLEPGDLIECPRGKFSHWAVYVGDGKVVHLTGDLDAGDDDLKGHLELISGDNLDKAEVKLEDFWVAVCESRAIKNNDNDKYFKPLSKPEIKEKARSKIGEKGYNLLWKNCEHFVNWCRYGLAWSDQVEKFVNEASAAIGSAIGSASSTLGTSSSSRRTEKHD